MVTKTAKRPRNWGDVFHKFMLCVGIGICLCFSQVAGWSVTGTMLADAGARRTVASTQSDVAATTLAQLRAERGGLVLPSKSKEALEADLKLERTRTSKTFKDGDGPLATKIKGDIATLNRAGELDAQIQAATVALTKAPATAKGEVDVAIPVGIAQRLGWIDVSDQAKQEAVKQEAADTAHFWFVVFFVAAAGFFATFGFMLVGVTHAEFTRGLALLADKPIVVLPLIVLCVEAGMNAVFGWRRADGSLFNITGYFQAAMFAGMAVLGAYLPTRWNGGEAHAAAKAESFLDSMDWGPKALPGERDEVRRAQQFIQQLTDQLGPDALDYINQDQVRALQRKLHEARGTPQGEGGLPPPLTGRPGPARPFEPASDPWPHYPQGYPGAYPSASHSLAPSQHGAPIHIHNTFETGGAPGVAAPASGPSPMERGHAQQPAEGARAATGEMTAAPAQGRALTPVTTGAPVDRTSVNRRSDQLLLFKQVCLEFAPGAIVSAESMYARYKAWAGERSMSEQAFTTLLSELADVPQEVIAGHLHFYDFAVRTTHLRAVSA